jgi:rare lipoprotein A
MMLRRLTPLVLSGFSIGLALSGCGTAPVPPPAPPSKPAGSYEVGQPYQIGGTWYYPADDFGYDESGFAAAYGPDGDGKLTANGEAFDPNLASGAHRTLALPTIVQVTNLDNGLTIPLRINDRGPPTGNRILGVSRRAAELLGFAANGTARVRVKVLVPATIEAQSLAKRNGGETAAGEAPPAVPHAQVLAETLAPPGASQAPPPSPVQPAQVPPQTIAPPKPAPSVAAVPRPVAPPQPVPVTAPRPVAAPPAKPGGAGLASVKATQIFIQAGAFASGANAQRMKEKLDGLGVVTVAEARVNGVDLYRVRIGPIPTVDEADRVLARALGAGASEAKIVVD